MKKKKQIAKDFINDPENSNLNENLKLNKKS